MKNQPDYTNQRLLLNPYHQPHHLLKSKFSISKPLYSSFFMTIVLLILICPCNPQTDICNPSPWIPVLNITTTVRPTVPTITHFRRCWTLCCWLRGFLALERCISLPLSFTCLTNIICTYCKNLLIPKQFMLLFQSKGTKLMHTSLINTHLPCRSETLAMQSQTASWSANFSNFTHFTNRSLVFRLILDPIEWTRCTRGATVDRCVRCSANFKFRKLIEFNFESIIGISLTNCFYLFGL